LSGKQQGDKKNLHLHLRRRSLRLVSGADRQESDDGVPAVTEDQMLAEFCVEAKLKQMIKVAGVSVVLLVLTAGVLLV
jgi:hypothetical protein